MKIIRLKFVALFLCFIAQSALGDVGFTRQDLDLVKGACLAGNNFEINLDADGGISVRNLSGNGKLHFTKKDVTTVDLPDSDKREEFKDIRECIRGYLLKDIQSLQKKCPNIAGKWHSDGNGLTMEISQPSCDRIFSNFPSHTLSGYWSKDRFSYEVVRSINGCTTIMYGYFDEIGNNTMQSNIKSSDGRCDLPGNFKEILAWERI